MNETLETVKWIVAAFLAILGLAFLCGAIIAKGNTAGKFKKGFCYVFGTGALLLGMYLID